MSEIKIASEGVIGILRLPGESGGVGRILALPQHPEDIRKKKQEWNSEDPEGRVVFEKGGSKIQSAISGGVKQINGLTKRDLHRENLQREARTEFGLELDADSIGGNFLEVGQINQIRDSREVQFMVSVFTHVLLREGQFDQLVAWFENNTDYSDRSLETILANPEYIKNFIEVNRGKIRPSLLLALIKAFGLEQEEVVARSSSQAKGYSLETKKMEPVSINI